jgi:hypothetical protein
MTKSATLVGKALYMEFRKTVNTAQIIITPEGITAEGKFVPSSSWRRQISAWSPKKPWKCYPNGESAIRQTDFDMTKALQTETDLENATFISSNMLGSINSVLNNLFSNDWVLYEKPIVLEFSQEDLEDTLNWATPSALIRRILRARKELGFAEELLDQPAE